MRNSILLLVLLVLVASGSGKEEPKKAKYCGKEVDRLMALLCQNVPQSGALQKRSFYSLAGKRAQYDLWRRVFNIDDNTKLSIPEASFQLDLLFGRCNDYQKQANLKKLLETYRNHEYKRNLNREYTNDRLVNGNYLNYEPSDEESLKELAFKPLLRFRRGIYEECCLEQCSVKEMKAYCPTD